MSYERRLCPRRSAKWTGWATFTGGPQVSARILDISASGARAEVPAAAGPCREALVELTAFKRRLGLLALGRPFSATGRVVRVAPGVDGEHVEIAVRFLTPVASQMRRSLAPQAELSWAGEGAVACG